MLDTDSDDCCSEDYDTDCFYQQVYVVQDAADVDMPELQYEDGVLVEQQESDSIMVGE